MTTDTAVETLDALHHVAIAVGDIAEAVEWYQKTFRCEIAYQDSTWAMLRFSNCNLALVTPGQHPPHLGFVTPTEVAESYGTLKGHRDGTRSIYIADPSGNPVELLAADSV
jgi:catechol 2,3-dioxygenase-like lactoylglutathione lyase family enzyme